MMRCNLAILLAERNLKITKVFNDTGISRTTLTSLYYNHAKGIQFDTYNTLCNYLKTTPDQLISYIPIDISIISIYGDQIEIQIQQNNIKCQASLYIEIDIDKKCIPEEEQEWIESVDITVGLFEAIDEEDLKEKALIVNTFKQLPTSFLSDLENQIIENVIISNDIPVAASIQFTWVDELDILCDYNL